jgi:ASC-1-like (ASCH) protein
MGFHELKSKSKYFEMVWSGNKRFEVRVNDRGYRVEDVVILKELMDDGNYTGRILVLRISNIFNSNELDPIFPLDPLWCIFGFSLLAMVEA